MRHRLRSLTVLFLVFAFALPLVCAQKSHAIPAFTRQYKTECSTCHTIYPELNEYGQAFQKNAYVYSAKSQGATRGGAPEAPVDAAQAQKPTSEKVEAIMLSGIPDWLPLSLTATQSITYQEHAPDGDNWDFATRSLVLQGGGAFRELAGFYATYNLFAHDTQGNQDDDARLHELFMVGRRIFKTPVNVKFGKFEPKLSLWKRSDKVIATSFAPAAYKVGGSQFSMETPQDALEVNAVVADRVFLAAGVVDRKGQNSKDGYGHISARFGGADFLGNEPVIDFDTDSIWDNFAVTLAAYGYAGRESETSGSSVRNSYSRFGGDMDLQYKRLRVRFSGVSGRDTNPFFVVPNDTVRSLVLATEADYQFGSPMNIIGVFRYEYQDDGAGITRRYIPAVAYAPLQNIRLVLQYNYETTQLTDNKLALLTAAFSF